MAKLIVITEARAKPGQREAIHRLFVRDLAPHARTNLDYEMLVWCDDEHDHDTFHIIEAFRARQDFSVSRKADWFMAYTEQAKPLLLEEPHVSVTAPRWSKDGKPQVL